MQYPVPQFVDVEDKIIGPFTIKQFGAIFIGGIIIVALFRVLQQSFFFYLLSIPILILTVIVAFGKFNGRSIYSTIAIFIKMAFAPKTMVFQKDPPDLHGVSLQPLSELHLAAPKKEEIVEPVQSRLRKLSMLLDQKSAEEIDVIKTIPISKNGQRQ